MKSDDLLSLLQSSYQLHGQITPLPGEVDLNFQFTDTQQKSYLLKVSAPNPDPEWNEFQDRLLHRLNSLPLQVATHRLIPNQLGAHYTELGNRIVKLYTWVSGTVVAKIAPHTAEFLYSIGQELGTITTGFHSFDHPKAHRDYIWDLAQFSKIPFPNSTSFDAPLGSAIDWFRTMYQDKVAPQLPTLRQSVIYNDANDYNLLAHIREGKLTLSGIIDLGDAVYSHTINDLAIACAYLIFGKKNPLRAAAALVRGYHERFPLEPNELAVLFPLIAARICTTIYVGWKNIQENPSNEYLQISQKDATNALLHLRDIDPSFAHYTFRQACGLDPCPQKAIFDHWMAQMPTFKPILQNLQAKEVDLSVGSATLGHFNNYLDDKAFDQRIQAIFQEKNTQLLIGGYLETRPLYTTDAYTYHGDEGPEWRTVHLGLDLWAVPHTPIFAPLEGKVYSLHDNKGDRNYGPTIILHHQPTPDLEFYTLYGHLSADSLPPLSVGQTISAGQAFAKIGPQPENGNWPSHAHFQIILDLVGNQVDFPGVGYPSDTPIWASICPNPRLLTTFDLPSNHDDHSEILLRKRAKYLGKNLSLSYRKPLEMVRGQMQYLIDRSGRRYLDTVNNVPHVGHQHPAVVEAGIRQMNLINTNTRYLHSTILEYAEELAQLFPNPLEVCFFVNSGSEANELALRMAKTVTKQEDFVVLETGYHGNTNACIGVSSYKFDGKGGQGAPPTTHKISMPDPFRGKYAADADGGTSRYVQEIQEVLASLREKGKSPAGFIHESILSCGGQVVPPPDFFKKTYASIRQFGGLCIADEVQTGMGRVGNHDWAFQLFGVVPDIVTLGKPIGNGHPIGAVVTTRKIADAFANGMEFFSTFGGNPVSTAIGLAVLQTVQKEGLKEQAHEVGNYLKNGLWQLADKFPLLADVRGAGLFLGFEMLQTYNGNHPATAKASYLVNRMREQGVLMSTDGPFENVIKIKPPICFTKTNADLLLGLLEKTLKESVLQDI